MSLSDLSPQSLWSNFEKINAVPRASKKEEQIIQSANISENQHNRVHARHYHIQKIDTAHATLTILNEAKNISRLIPRINEVKKKIKIKKF